MNDNDITEFFESLTPDKFTSTEGAYRVEYLEEPQDSYEEMNYFFNSCIDGTRLYYDMASQLPLQQPEGGFFIPFAIVHGVTQRRFYRIRDGEDNRVFFERVRDDIADMQVLWFYTAVEAVAFLGYTGLDVSTPAKTKKLQETHPHADAINWYFESVQDGSEHMVYGAISTDGDKTQVIYTAKSAGGESPLFRMTLDAHRN